MSFEKHGYNPWAQTYPFHCTQANVSEIEWSWLYNTVSSENWVWDLVYDPAVSEISGCVWLGFKRQEDYLRFCLTWI